MSNKPPTHDHIDEYPFGMTFYREGYGEVIVSLIAQQKGFGLPKSGYIPVVYKNKRTGLIDYNGLWADPDNDFK